MEGDRATAHPHPNGLVTGHRSVKEKEWLESFKVFGIGKDDDKKIIQRLGLTLLSDHEKLFGRY